MPGNLIDLLGWTASALVLATFSLKTMIPLRMVAIASNVVFFSYGMLDHLMPITVLHGILFPINVYRFLQLRVLVARTRKAIHSEVRPFPWERIVSLLETKHFPAGTILMHKGDLADRMYLILDGTVRVEGKGITLGRGHVVGEIGLVTSEHLRTETVICDTALEAGVLSEEKIWSLFFQNPEFGVFLIKTVTSRLLADARKPPAELID